MSVITDTTQPNAALGFSDGVTSDFRPAAYPPSEHVHRCKGAAERSSATRRGGTNRYPVFLVTCGEYHGADSYALYCYDCMQAWPAYSVPETDAYPSDETIIAAAERDWGKPAPDAPVCAQCGTRSKDLRDRDGQRVCHRCYDQPSLFSLAGGAA